jgi:hypothetical protein
MSETMDTELRKIIDSELNKTILKISPKSKVSQDMNNTLNNTMKGISPKVKLSKELKYLVNKALKKLSPKARVSREVIYLLTNVVKKISPKTVIPNEVYNLLANSKKHISPKTSIPNELNLLINKSLNKVSPKTNISKELDNLLTNSIKKVSPKSKIPLEMNNNLKNTIKNISPKVEIPKELIDILENKLKNKTKVNPEVINSLVTAIKKTSPKPEIKKELTKINNILNKVQVISSKSLTSLPLNNKIIKPLDISKKSTPIKIVSDKINKEIIKKISKNSIKEIPKEIVKKEVSKIIDKTIKQNSPKNIIVKDVTKLVNIIVSKKVVDTKKIIKKISKQIITTIRKKEDVKKNKIVEYILPKSLNSSPKSVNTPKSLNSLLNINYDYIIIGGGPTGLTLAWYLGKTNKKVLIVEKESTLGGCHRVQRVDGLFTEHGPRVYSDSYINFINLLEDMDLKFNDLFTEYNFDLSNIGNKTKYDLSKYELICFTLAILKLSFVEDYGKNKSIKTFMDENSFSEESKEYIDRVCRLTDGAKSDKYTLFQFLQLANQQVLYKLYQPKLPNDRGLIKLWSEKLLSNKNIDILLNHDVIKLNKSNNIIVSVDIKDNISLNNYKLNGKNFIFTTPPKPMINLLKKSNGCEDAFGPIKLFEKWGLQNSYFDYIPITLHWNNKIKLPKIQGFPSSDWGLAFIVLSNYMKFKDNIELKNSKTVISTCITFPENISKKIKKTAHQCTMQEIYDEVLVQLRIVYPDLPMPDRMIVSPQVYRNENTKKWVNIDTAYVSTNENTIIPNESSLFKNLYNCGAHNGNSNYYFTSIETAVSNAQFLSNKLEPSLKLTLKHTNQISNFIYFSSLIFIVFIYVKLFGKFIW